MSRSEPYPPGRPIRLGFVLTDGFALMSYAAVIEPFRAANKLAGRTLYEWCHLSPGGEPMPASNGASLIVDGGLGPDILFDRLFVLAAGDPSTFHDEGCFGWLRRVARQGATIIGVSGGPYILARAGLLSGSRATIHWEHRAAFEDEFPEISVEHGLYVADGQRITCAGGTAGLDLATWLIARDHGEALSRAVGEWFIRPETRGSDVSQRASLRERFKTANGRLLTMLAEMEGAIDEPLARADLASRAGVTVRQLERLAQVHLGTTVAKIYLRIRLDHADHLLRTTSEPLTTVALNCGFRSASHFSRCFGAKYGRSPSRVRATG